MNFKIAFSWLLGGTVCIVLMLIFMKVTGINIPTWLGFILMIAFVTIGQKIFSKRK